jgi:hypothetical protein
MKKLLVSVIVFGIYVSAFPQDLVILKNGHKFENCRIIKEDSVNVYFEFEKNGHAINTFIPKEKILSYQYNYKNGSNNLPDSIYSLEPKEISNVGIGLGLDYGGIIGVNLLLYPQQNIGLFAGAGFAFIGIGYNAGIKLRFNAKQVNPYILGMYGYNTAIKITNASQFDKFFYGPTLGFGLDFGSSRHNRNGYFTCALLFPIRGQEVSDYIDDLKNNHGVEFTMGLIPIAISLGYRIKLQ